MSTVDDSGSPLLPPSFNLITFKSCCNFVQTHPPSVIATQLLRDQSLCRKGKGVPSLLVHCLPPSRDKGATNAIARALCELDDDTSNSTGPGPKQVKTKHATKIPLIVAKMRYTSIVASIKAYLASLGDFKPEDEDESNMAQTTEGIPNHLIPTEDELHGAVKVLRYLQLPHTQHNYHSPGSTSTSTNVDDIEKVLALVHSQLNRDESMKNAERKQWTGVGGRKACYICRFFTTSTHPLYPSLCHPCGEFNISSSAISSPQNLRLEGKVALITGGRINLGFHTALRLLRCGSSVIVTSRYPQDAWTKYLEEADYLQWKDRLRIVGADFRAAKDVFDLVVEVEAILESWGTQKLDILINNAAQTLTDPIEKEQASIRRERILLESSRDNHLVAETQYEPRVRGGQSIRYLTSQRTERLVEDTLHHQQEGVSLDVTTTFKSSWAQGISEIPYEDVISAHSVNTFVPFILLRELLPLLRGPPKSSLQGTRPIAYVINVSSREGISERNIASGTKAGHHVHTNMSKAALNMLTETEAAKTWKEDKVSINAVDPGYMSADPMWMEMVGRSGQACPLGWEDGAARVLWPVAKGEAEGVAIWGRFLKHFAQLDVSR